MRSPIAVVPHRSRSSRDMGEEENSMEILIMLVGVLVLDVAAWRWGVDSREGEAHPEWERPTLRDFEREEGEPGREEKKTSGFLF